MRDDVIMISPGAYNFAEYLYQILECDYTYIREPVDRETVILFGMFMSNGNPMRPAFRAKKRIAVWIGTDVMHLESYLKGHQGEQKEFNKHLDVKLATSTGLAAELESLGVKMDGVVETPPRYVFEPMPLPEKFSVGIYAPVKRETHYYTDLCFEVARAMPDVNFYVYGRNREIGQIDKNIFDLGRINLKREIPNISAIMRFTIHDGTGLGPVEYMQAGRRAVTNLGLPHAYNCDPDLDQIVANLREIQKEKEPDKEASDYWRERINHAKYREEMYRWL